MNKQITPLEMKFVLQISKFRKLSHVVNYNELFNPLNSQHNILMGSGDQLFTAFMIEQLKKGINPNVFVVEFYMN